MKRSPEELKKLIRLPLQYTCGAPRLPSYILSAFNTPLLQTCLEGDDDLAAEIVEALNRYHWALDVVEQLLRAPALNFDDLEQADIDAIERAQKLLKEVE